MGFVSALAQSLGLRQKSAAGAAFPTQGFLPTLGSTPSASGLQISQGTAISVSTVYACVTIRAQDFARCTPRIFRRAAGEAGRTQVTDHPLARLFAKPNRAQTWFEFAEQMETAFLLRGNAYAAVRRDSRGRPVELIPINPDAVLVLEASDGSIFYNVNRIGLWQIAMLRDFPPSIAAADILHIRNFSFNALVGVSTIGVARDAIGLAMGQEQQASRWMANGARPSFALLLKSRLSEAAALRLKTQFNSVAQGLNNTGNTVILEEGIEPKPLQLTSEDLEFLAQRNFSVSDIARFWRIPPHKLGAEVMRGINVDQVNQDYVNNTVMPDLHRFEQKFADYFGLDPAEFDVDMDETVLLRADLTARLNAARIGVLTGVFTRNEVRVSENLPPKPGGDDLLMPSNMAPAGSAIGGNAPDGAGRPEAGAAPSTEAGAGASASEEETP